MQNPFPFLRNLLHHLPNIIVPILTIMLRDKLGVFGVQGEVNANLHAVVFEDAGFVILLEQGAEAIYFMLVFAARSAFGVNKEDAVSVTLF